ncbi:MAG: T9SS type A sorting domain-containing protein, partial [Bacteroidota bacterium]
QAQENRYFLYDDEGNIVFRRMFLANNRTYFDTLNLPDGCYHFVLEDDQRGFLGNDGLSFWNHGTSGNGYARFVNPDGSFAISFEPDFGASISHQFTIGYNVGEEFLDRECIDVTSNAPQQSKALDIKISPNPNEGKFYVHLPEMSNQSTWNIILYNVMGQTVWEKEVSAQGTRLQAVDVSLPSGAYWIRASSGEYILTKKLTIE